MLATLHSLDIRSSSPIFLDGSGSARRVDQPRRAFFGLRKIESFVHKSSFDTQREDDDHDGDKHRDGLWGFVEAGTHRRIALRLLLSQYLDECFTLTALVFAKTIASSRLPFQHLQR